MNVLNIKRNFCLLKFPKDVFYIQRRRDSAWLHNKHVKYLYTAALLLSFTAVPTKWATEQHNSIRQYDMDGPHVSTCCLVLMWKKDSGGVRHSNLL
jgi:hypothetical protein